MPNPVTTPGRVLDIFLSIWAITVAATLAAALAAFFRARHVEDTDQPHPLGSAGHHRDTTRVPPSSGPRR